MHDLVLAALAAFSLTSAARAQGVIQQSGPVTLYRPPAFVANSVQADGGGPSTGLSALGLFNGANPPPTAGSNARTAAARDADTLSALDFIGVDPTGTNDSTTGLQNFITAVGTGTGFIPAGTYKLSRSGLAIGSHQHIEGAGKAATILNYIGTGAAISMTGAGQYAAGMTLSDFTVQIANGSTAGIYIYDVNGFYLRNINVVGTTQGGVCYSFNDVNAGEISNSDALSCNIGANYANSANLIHWHSGNIGLNNTAIVGVAPGTGGDTVESVNISSTLTSPVIQVAGNDWVFKSDWFESNFAAVFAGSIAPMAGVGVLTVTALMKGTIAVGLSLGSNAGITSGTMVTANAASGGTPCGGSACTGAGGTGTYAVSASQTVSSETINGYGTDIELTGYGGEIESNYILDAAAMFVDIIGVSKHISVDKNIIGAQVVDLVADNSTLGSNDASFNGGAETPVFVDNTSQQNFYCQGAGTLINTAGTASCGVPPRLALAQTWSANQTFSAPVLLSTGAASAPALQWSREATTGCWFGGVAGTSDELLCNMTGSSGEFALKIAGNYASTMTTTAAEFYVPLKTTISLAFTDLAFSDTAPTVASGLGTSPIVTANGTAAFKIVVGSSGTPSTAEVLIMPTATNGWVCNAYDTTTTADTAKETAFTTASVTETWSSAPSLNDVLVHSCTGF